jgi:hypothetical protein
MNMKALPIVEKGVCCCVWSCVLLRLVFCVVALCIALLHSALVKEVMGWRWRRYFADVYVCILQLYKYKCKLRLYFYWVIHQGNTNATCVCICFFVDKGVEMTEIYSKYNRVFLRLYLYFVFRYQWGLAISKTGGSNLKLAFKKKWLEFFVAPTFDEHHLTSNDKITQTKEWELVKVESCYTL